jgi:hypothetical protein
LDRMVFRVVCRNKRSIPGERTPATIANSDEADFVLAEAHGFAPCSDGDDVVVAWRIERLKMEGAATCSCRRGPSGRLGGH